MDTKEIISIVVAAIVGAVWGVLELRRWRKDKRSKQIEDEKGLLPNPARCGDHEDRLRKVETVCIEVGPKIDAMSKDIDEIRTDVKTLVNMHLKP